MKKNLKKWKVGFDQEMKVFKISMVSGFEGSESELLLGLVEALERLEIG